MAENEEQMARCKAVTKFGTRCRRGGPMYGMCSVHYWEWYKNKYSEEEGEEYFY